MSQYVKRETIAGHLAAIKSGTVTRTNVIGIRKALNAYSKRDWGTSRKVPAWLGDAVLGLLGALDEHRPRVVGELHDSGVAQLQAKRYRKQLDNVADIVANVAEFRLVDYDELGRHGEYHVPVYEARDAEGNAFTFRNVPWQSGGNGPEVITF